MRKTKKLKHDDMFDNPIWITLLITLGLANVVIGIIRMNFVSIFNIAIGLALVYQGIIRIGERNRR